MSIWSGFFKKTLRERQDQIRLIYPHLDTNVLDDGGLPGSVADVMARSARRQNHCCFRRFVSWITIFFFFTSSFFDITAQVENCIGVASLPLGVAPNFVVNGQHYVVPMCVEEPSVIAAASGVAKLLASHGGFTASSTPNVMTAEVQLCDFARYSSSHTMIVVFPVVSLLFPIRGVLWLPAWRQWRLPLP